MPQAQESTGEEIILEGDQTVDNGQRGGRREVCKDSCDDRFEDPTTGSESAERGVSTSKAREGGAACVNASSWTRTRDGVVGMASGSRESERERTIGRGVRWREALEQIREGRGVGRWAWRGAERRRCGGEERWLMSAEVYDVCSLVALSIRRTIVYMLFLLHWHGVLCDPVSSYPECMSIRIFVARYDTSFNYIGVKDDRRNKRVSYEIFCRLVQLCAGQITDYNTPKQFDEVCKKKLGERDEPQSKRRDIAFNRHWILKQEDLKL
nr:hypothetical protein Iba_chr05cCG9870 [Ipomoea batatas]